jgi:hypothetical protein
MTAKICIATASQDLFDSLRLTLARDEIGLTAIGTDRLPDAQAARAWLDSRDRALLILDSDLPPTTGGNEDRSNGTHARDLLKQVRRSGITTPILVIMQGCLLDLEADCNPDNRAIALPLEKLQRFQAEILKPFLAMLMPPEDKTDNKPEIPGTFRVIEVDFCRDRSTCSRGSRPSNCARCGSPRACSRTWTSIASAAGSTRSGWAAKPCSAATSWTRSVQACSRTSNGRQAV